MVRRVLTSRVEDGAACARARGRALTPLAAPRPPSPRILTHDFTHRTHAAIFGGLHYPRALPDWSSDDWITFVYSAFGLQTKLPEAVVGHTFVLGTRYEPTAKATRLLALNAELNTGAARVAEWLRVEKGTTLPYTVKVVDCC